MGKFRQVRIQGLRIGALRILAFPGEVFSQTTIAVKSQQQELGDKVRALLADRGVNSVAAEGFQAPGVVVCYTTDADVQTGVKFAANGLQIAAGVPLQCDEPEDFQTFRLGLFGLDKLHNVDRTVKYLADALDHIL